MAGVDSSVAYLRIGGAPAPAASRVEAIHDAVDLNDADLAATFGERARLEVVTLIERLLAETRAGDLGGCAPLMAHIDDRLHQLNPVALRKRRGMAGWFDNRRKRLKAFRETFVTAAAAMSETAGAMVDHASGVARRSQALETLWAETRVAITELDAYVAAGLERLSEGVARETPHPLEERLAALVALRNSAVRQLPLVRLAQNADCNIPDRLKTLAGAVSAWRDEWREALGLNRKRPKMISPDHDWLMRERDGLIAALERVGRDLAEAGARRGQAAGRMERVAESVRRAVPKS